MIPAFWMPNPSWAGCAVDDPSARVLSNYGASGPMSGCNRTPRQVLTREPVQ